MVTERRCIRRVGGVNLRLVPVLSPGESPLTLSLGDSRSWILLKLWLQLQATPGESAPAPGGPSFLNPPEVELLSDASAPILPHLSFHSSLHEGSWTQLRADGTLGFQSIIPNIYRHLRPVSL